MTLHDFWFYFVSPMFTAFFSPFQSLGMVGDLHLDDCICIYVVAVGLIAGTFRLVWRLLATK